MMVALDPSVRVAVLGVPYDASSSFLQGAALAPARIREVLHDGAANLCAESGRDLGQSTAWKDVGDLDLDADYEALGDIEQAVTALLQQEVRVLSLGGDHAITYPIVRAFARQHQGLNILHFDAHPDLYDELDGNRLSHACPFARIMEAGLAKRLVQVGIRTMNPHQQAQAERFGVEVMEMRNGLPERLPAFDGPVYLSLDMDVLDPAFAPGVSHHEPGGLSTRELLHLLQRLEATVVGADLVEFNPRRDPVGITAMLAAKLTKELIDLML